MDLTLAATIALNAMTASQALDYLPLRPRDILLVTGAAGAVGGYAVELARAEGGSSRRAGRGRRVRSDRGIAQAKARRSWLSAHVHGVVPEQREQLGGVLLRARVVAGDRQGGLRGSVPPAADPVGRRRLWPQETTVGGGPPDDQKT